MASWSRIVGRCWTLSQEETMNVWDRTLRNVCNLYLGCSLSFVKLEIILYGNQTLWVVKQHKPLRTLRKCLRASENNTVQLLLCYRIFLFYAIISHEAIQRAQLIMNLRMLLPKLFLVYSTIGMSCFVLKSAHPSTTSTLDPRLV